jgi:hypothetical protein
LPRGPASPGNDKSADTHRSGKRRDGCNWLDLRLEEAAMGDSAQLLGEFPQRNSRRETHVESDARGFVLSPR